MSTSRHPADLPDAELLRDCRMSRTRGSGPGGQRRNKVETAVVLEHVPTGHLARASESRDPEANRRSALRRLRFVLALRERRAWDAPTTRWTDRARGGRIAVSARHADVAPLVAEALDALCAHGWDGPGAAAALGVSTSQLVRLLGTHPRALGVWNDERTARGLRPLRA